MSVENTKKLVVKNSFWSDYFTKQIKLLGHDEYLLVPFHGVIFRVDKINKKLIVILEYFGYAGSVDDEVIIQIANLIGYEVMRQVESVVEDPAQFARKFFDLATASSNDRMYYDRDFVKTMESYARRRAGTRQIA